MTFILSIKENYKYLFYLIFSLILTRIISFFYLNITIDEKWLFGLWQHIKLDYFQNNFLESLFYFHAQPPLWNFILGIGVKISNLIKLNLFINSINFLITSLIIYSSYHLLKNLNFNRCQSYFLILFLIILSPSILFYENFPSYAHLTCLLLFLIKLNFLKIYKKFKIKYEFQIYSYSSMVILSWSAYLIYFNIIIFFLLLPLIIRKKRILKSFLIFSIFFIIGMTPSIKNKLVFDVFLNSSWSGLNAAQATGYDRENWPLCSFTTQNLKTYNAIYKDNLNYKVYLNKDILNDNTYNDLGYIYKSTKCHNSAKKHLIKNFYSITKQKIARFFTVHAHLSIDFAFKPKNWIKHFSTLEKMNNNNFFKIIVIFFFGLNYFFYAAITLNSLRDRNKNFLSYFLTINLILYLYLLFVAFYGSTWEQERMRYTGYSFIFISTCLIIKELFLKKKLNLLKFRV